MDRPTRHSKIALRIISIAGVSIVLAFHGTLYRIEEVFACWLFFTLVFVLITMTAAIGVAIYSAILGILRFTTSAARAILHVPLTNPTLHPK
jgi:hypothetical protein